MWGHGSKCRSHTTQSDVGGAEQDIETLCFPGQEPIVAAAGSSLKDWTSPSLTGGKDAQDSVDKKFNLVIRSAEF